ncbi:TlpA disulfide reductase family protein [Sphingobacterium gobiense]|uniref:Thioredoxin domain-containing protein n=1 Tax=Sphingobacterium gobiense TaxID=1382456 RepID=A0A2S9JGD9_9SPHI|nr:TlpA disulfide reductase family protein [Sphingobacterium gobiense]PRD52009.1 hypothetical protein C5749_17070 [Sphingobacterium gobiense]
MISLQSIKKGIIPAIAIVVMASCGQAEKTEYHIKGSIAGVETGMLKMIRYNDEDRTSETLDSVQLKDGTFAFSGKLAHPEMLSFLVTPGNWRFMAFIENGDLTLEADTTGAAHYDYSEYGGAKGANIETIQVIGSSSHDQYLSYQNDAKNVAFKSALKEIHARYEKPGITAKEQDEVRSEVDSIRKLQQAWEIDWIGKFVDDHPESVVGPYLFYNHYIFNTSLPLQQMEAIVASFEGEATQSAHYKLLDKDVKKRSALMPGNSAPDFTALRPDSTEFALSSLRGKHVLLDFWASWCVPCRKAIPHWKEVYAKYQDKGLEIVAVTNDNNWDAWFKALEVEKMPWIQVADDFPIKNMPSRIGTMYMVPALPSYTLLDADGKIVLHNASKEEITGAIEERLK